MFLNIKEMSRALCFDNSVTNNALFGRQVHYFIEIIEKKSTPFQRVLKTYNLIKIFLF